MTLKDLAKPMAAQPVVDETLASIVREALVSNALPGELDGFSDQERDEVGQRQFPIFLVCLIAVSFCFGKT